MFTDTNATLRGALLGENLAGPIERLDRHQVDLSRQRKIAEERDRHERGGRLPAEPSRLLLVVGRPGGLGRRTSFRMLRGKMPQPPGGLALLVIGVGRRSLRRSGRGRVRNFRGPRLRRLEPESGELRRPAELWRRRRARHRAGAFARASCN